jgi:hypothetical protein
VSNSDDNQDYPKTLPSPELNPLTNPVLGRNMGRWAEVYFTSPPEKREQAVQELLRELERDSSTGESSAQVTAVPSEPGNAAEEDRTRLSKNSSANLPATFSPNFSENSPETPAATNPEFSAATSEKAVEISPGLPPSLRQEFIQCHSCGQLWLVEQKFCGACGDALPVREGVLDAALRNGNSAQASPTPAPGQLELAATADHVEPDRVKEKFEEEVEVVEGKIRKERFSEPRGDEKIDQFPIPGESVIQDRQLIWAQGVKPSTDDLPRLFLDQERARQRRSRVLMGTALVILVGTLFYVGARGTAPWLRAHDGAQNAGAKAVSAAGGSSSSSGGGSAGAASDGSSLAGSSSAGSSLPPKTANRGANPAVAVHALSPAPAGYSPTRRDDKKNPGEHDGSGAGTSSQKAIVPTSAAEEKLNPLSDHVGHGAEELAIAESYLSGTQGKARDSSEAAQWLWKSVGKQNAAAALLLSDLYVTGDGVPRNCDQARLLLDAAARKGVPGAGERIRDLPNVGCQ